MDGSVKEWIEKKMDEGVSDERIKKTLKETGKDPDLVDEVKSPFEGNEDNDAEEDMKPSSGQEEADGTPSSGQEEAEEEGFDSLDFIDPEEEDEDEDSGESSETPSSGQEEDDEGSESSFSLPSISVPSVHLGRKKLVIVVLVLLISGFWYSGFSFFDGGSISGVTGALGPSCDERVGVKLVSVGIRYDRTLARVYTDEEAEMVLEIFSGDKKMGESTKTINGEDSIRANAVGDRAVFHKKGCDEPSAEISY